MNGNCINSRCTCHGGWTGTNCDQSILKLYSYIINLIDYEIHLKCVLQLIKWILSNILTCVQCMYPLNYTHTLYMYIQEHVPATARTEVCVSVTTVAPVQQAGLDQLVSELSALLRVSMVTVSTPRLSVSVMKAGEERTATKVLYYIALL